MKTFFQFKKQRELGEIISDSFGFIRHEYKPFFSTILKICAPFILIYLGCMVFYLYAAVDMFDFNSSSRNGLFSGGIMLLSVGLFVVSAILAYVFASASALHYIKNYIHNNGVINESEIKQAVYQQITGFLGLGVLKWITLIIGAMLCFLPVLYLMVPMFIVFSIYVFEDKDVSDSYSYSFTLIKDEFWMTFFTLIIMYIIITIAGYAFSLPASLYSMIKMGTFSSEFDPSDMSSFFDPIMILLNIIAYFFQYVLNLVLVISAVLVYFNLNEKKHLTGTFEQIESIGSDS
ncbi:hypothetical protein [Mangrovimonas sp. ST2L15]|uniref:hypothetical protein n=1 Tax=Mangrovimonas sp. ST2L15 TaxID=1645916 RepID=UPI0006B40937|nr:hypothetical protein [Mangrovimonas sp. ST2L15]